MIKLYYLLGIHVFYKVVAVKKELLTEFQSFNLQGELNKECKKQRLRLVDSQQRHKKWRIWV